LIISNKIDNEKLQTIQNEVWLKLLLSKTILLLKRIFYHSFNELKVY